MILLSFTMLLAKDLNKRLVIQSNYLKKKYPHYTGDDGAKIKVSKKVFGLSMHERFDLPCWYNAVCSTTFLGSMST